jgi:hypothetical protein
MKDHEQFLAVVRQRLEAGAKEYGDASHRLPVGDLLDEIQQELADVCGWSAILWGRLEHLRKLAAQEKKEQP